MIDLLNEERFVVEGGYGIPETQSFLEFSLIGDENLIGHLLWAFAREPEKNSMTDIPISYLFPSSEDFEYAFLQCGLVDPKNHNDFNDPLYPHREVLYIYKREINTFFQNRELVTKLVKAARYFDSDLFIDVANKTRIKKLTKKEQDKFKKQYKILEERHNEELSQPEQWIRSVSNHLLEAK